jgi:hypothetical protein
MILSPQHCRDSESAEHISPYVRQEGLLMLEDEFWILALVRIGRLSTCMTSNTDDVDRGSFMVRMEASGLCVNVWIGMLWEFDDYL